MKLALGGAAAGLALALSTLPAAATDFQGSYQVTYNTKDPGLVVDASPASGDLTFSLQPQGSTTIDLFDLYTNETTVNLSDDTAPKPISVAFNFTEPSPAFEGSVAGTTQGNLQLFGLFQNGSVTWDNHGDQVLDFGDGGILDVHLNNATFDQSFLGLRGGAGAGAEITGTFTLAHAAAVSAAPEPASWALLIGGLGILGGALRVMQARRREDEMSRLSA